MGAEVRAPARPSRRSTGLHRQKRGGLTLETTVAGAKLTLLVANCKVYRLQVKGNRVEEIEVLRTGFLLWFSGCVGQSIRMAEGYIVVELINRELGAGGGNASGGVYRSRDGTDWEKHTRKGWLARK
jgi:hypothetical protein